MIALGGKKWGELKARPKRRAGGGAPKAANKSGDLECIVTMMVTPMQTSIGANREIEAVLMVKLDAAIRAKGMIPVGAVGITIEKNVKGGSLWRVTGMQKAAFERPTITKEVLQDAQRLMLTRSSPLVTTTTGTTYVSPDPYQKTEEKR